MYEICVVRYRKLTRVTSIDVVQVMPTYLVLGGPKIARAEAVLLNGVPVTEFQAYGDDEHLLVRVPPALAQSPITSVAAYLGSVGGDQSDELEFAVTSEMCSGLARIIQNILKLLITTVGTDIFEPESGGSLAELRGVTLDNIPAVTGYVTQSVKRVKDQILKSQAGKTMDPDDKLMYLKLIQVTTSLQNTAVGVNLFVQSGSGAARAYFPIGGAT